MSASKKQPQQPAAATTPSTMAAVTQPAAPTPTPMPTSTAAATTTVPAIASTTAQPQHYYAHPGANYYSHYSYSYHASTWASHLQAQGRTMATTAGTPGVGTPATIGTPQHQAYYQTTPPVLPPTAPHSSANNPSTTANQNSSQSQTQTQSQSQLDTSDIATLNDALGSAGVDLRAEEENLRQSHAGGGSGKAAASSAVGTSRGRGKKQGKKIAFDHTHLGARMKGIASKHGLSTGSTSTTSGVTDDSIVYIALALRARLTTLIEAMVAAAAHREETGVSRPAGLYPGGTPMWSQVVRRDVGKQLAVIEKVEREEELAARRERKARETYGSTGAGAGGILSASALPSLDDALQMDTTDDEPKKKKKKPDGPGVTAKNMTEDVRKKLSNAVASQAAGLSTGKYAWMNAGTTTAAIPKKPATAAGSSGGSSTTAAANTTTTGTTASSWSRPFQSAKKKEEPSTPDEDKRRAITLRDAIFVVERERGHGGGRGSARGWT